MDVGFVGLGQMGHAIAANLIAAGHAVSVWNRSVGKAEALVAAGARLAADPADAARGGIVMTMLADDRAVEAVTFGARGILAAGSDTLHVSLSTIGVALAARLAAAHGEAGGSYVSAPVFGRPNAAEAAKLFVVAAGPEDAVARCRPLFEAIGQRLFVVGTEPVAANIVKLGGNFMIMAAVEAMAEAMTLAGRYGVAKAQLLEVLTGTIFGAPVYENYGRMIVADQYRPAGFAAPLGLKDMGLVAEAALAARVPMPALSLVRDRLIATIAREGDEIDWAGIAKLVADDAGG